jgi:hypothetical protein
MYCPLCKAEYRAGFEQCSDCLARLVPSREQAEAANVILLWGGTRQSRFNKIVGALRDANIPNYARSGAESERKSSFWAHVPLIGLFIRDGEAYEAMSWKIFVMESDCANARTIADKQAD